MESLLRWGIANSAPQDGNQPPPQARTDLDPGIIDAILGKSDAELMKEALAVAVLVDEAEGMSRGGERTGAARSGEGDRSTGSIGMLDTSTGGAVSAGAGAGGSAGGTAGPDAEEGAGALVPDAEACGCAGTVCDCGSAASLLGFAREKPNQEDREGVDLVARMVFCGSAAGKGTAPAPSCGGGRDSGCIWLCGSAPVWASDLGSSGGVGAGREASMGFGDSVRSTGFDADPGLGQRKSK